MSDFDSQYAKSRLYASTGNLNANENNGYNPQRRRSSRRQSAFIPNSFMPNLVFVNNDNKRSSVFYPATDDNASAPFYAYGSGGPVGYCNECESYSYLVKCFPHCDLFLCESCQQDHWQNEIRDLLKYKASLEKKVNDMKKYLELKRKQCTENIKSSQQIKRFISMTMQQIKRKIEVELESKRDELYNVIDTFADNQKKLNQSISEDGFTTSTKIFQEIENMMIMSENGINFFKIKNMKEFIKLEIQKLDREKVNRVPFYSILFIPDSTVEVQNSFGKIVLKPYREDDIDDDDDLIDNHDINNSEDFFMKNNFKKPIPQTNETSNRYPTDIPFISKLRSDSIQKWNSVHNVNLAEKPNYSFKPFKPVAKSFGALKNNFYDSLNSVVDTVAEEEKDEPVEFTDELSVDNYENQINEETIKPRPRHKSAPPPLKKNSPKLRRAAETAVYDSNIKNEVNQKHFKNSSDDDDDGEDEGKKNIYI